MRQRGAFGYQKNNKFLEEQSNYNIPDDGNKLSQEENTL
jgi:hypothetical protein